MLILIFLQLKALEKVLFLSLQPSLGISDVRSFALFRSQLRSFYTLIASLGPSCRDIRELSQMPSAEGKSGLAYVTPYRANPQFSLSGSYQSIEAPQLLVSPSSYQVAHGQITKSLVVNPTLGQAIVACYPLGQATACPKIFL